jgi:ribose/xylose/arabinose/galactoside ABC-type transport system permease subunit
VVLFFLFLGLILIGAVIALLAKDFAIPLMAMENVGITDAWRRLLPMLAVEKLSYAGYVGMKILLAIASGIIFGLANLMAIILLLIPMGIAGLAGYFIAQGMGLEWNLGTITLVVLLAAAAFHVLLAVVCFISVPPMVFFQSYALHFFGSRYPALGELVFPPLPPSPPPLSPTPAPAA